MQIALCQINPLVGAIKENAKKIRSFALNAHKKGAKLAVFPELSICGYPPKDILFRPELHQQIQQALKLFEELPLHVLVGAPVENKSDYGQPLWNAAVLCGLGSQKVVATKQLIPNYDVFDERRYFEPGPKAAANSFEVDSVKFGVLVCEDAWKKESGALKDLYDIDPLDSLKDQNVDVLINLSASPFAVDKVKKREELFSSKAKKLNKPFLVVGQTGANDGLVFDGHTKVFDKYGCARQGLKLFEEGELLLEVTLGGEVRFKDECPSTISALDRLSLIEQALVLGIKDYVEKCNAPGVLVGVSGGVDSALTAALAVKALGSKKVIGIRMPSQFSSKHSLEDAEDLASALGFKLVDLPVEPIVETCRQSLKHLQSKSGQLPDIVDQNIQARVRGLLLMALSNENQHLVLATGNKSELAMGYATLHGDMCGALAPLGDLYKSDVWELARHMNKDRTMIPQNSIEKPPSAELKKDQLDEDSLLPYPVLDKILRLYVDEDRSESDILNAVKVSKAEIRQVIRTVNLSDYKRAQAAIILKVSNRVFGEGRRWPACKGFAPGLD